MEGQCVTTELDKLYEFYDINSNYNTSLAV